MKFNRSFLGLASLGAIIGAAGIQPTAPRMVSPCARKHCTRPAAFNPVLRIPAVGHAIADHEPLSVIVPVGFCDECLATMNAGEFLDEGCKRQVRAACDKQAKEKPDFARAYIQKKPL